MAAPFETRVAAPEVRAGACLDPSASTIADFSETVKSNLERTVRGWVAQQGVDAQQGAQPQPGLRLMVRQVLTNSFTSSAPSIAVVVPATPGLVAEPAVTSASFVEDDTVWQAARRRFDADQAAAAAAATQGASQIGAYALHHGESSEIAGCVSALAATLTGPSRRFVIASDLIQTEPEQLAGDLAGADVLIVQPCGGDATACSTAAREWTAALQRRGAVAVAVIRPEQSSPATYTTFLQKGALS